LESRSAFEGKAKRTRGGEQRFLLLTKEKNRYVLTYGELVEALLSAVPNPDKPPTNESVPPVEEGEARNAGKGHTPLKGKILDCSKV